MATGVHTITLDLPEDVYVRLKDLAARTPRSIESALLDLAARAVRIDGELSPDIELKLALMALMNDDELLQAAKSRLSKRDMKQLRSMHLRRQSGELTEDEARESRRLIEQYDYAVLIHSQALLPLQQRGHDVNKLHAPA
jgi:hypothetical protein